MGQNFVNIDRDTPMLLPADLREWVAADDPVHLVIEAVGAMDLRAVTANARGTGSAQYPPGMMLGLLIYCYGQGIYSSRRIEAASHRDLAVRYLTGDTHPDHDTIAHFRRTHGELLRQAFVEVLRLAREMGVPQLGTIVLDGTKLRANASARHNHRARELQAELAALENEVAGRLSQAERADTTPGPRETLPAELADPARRRARLAAARAALQRRAAAHDRPPGDDDLGNTTDPDSRVQRTPQGFIQGYNAQLAVSAESGLIVAARVCDAAHDREQLAPTVAAIPPAAGPVRIVIADTGYDHHEQVLAVERARGATVYVPPQRPLETTARQSQTRATRTQERHARHARMQSAAGRQFQRLRRSVVEPVFGTLKSAWRFTRFHLRGLAAVEAEWTLLCVAYNLRKLQRWRLTTA